MLLRHKKTIGVIAAIAAVMLAFTFFSRKEKVDFNTQVKPIFNRKCISCHGGVKQKAGFSLLFREEALANTESGQPAIIPGKPGRSELIRRVSANDPEERMPYKHDPLSRKEISILRRWIKQGAEWGEHWAYIPVQKEKIPNYKDAWIKNDIDRFVYKKLQEEKMSPSAEADKATLLRRVSLDLTGLPPSEAVARQFLEDSSAGAYEQLVDALLASSRYGEKWTSLWLDLARYADTKGYESDQGRSIWQYRDWLIQAFNADKPYNDFLVEQLAGDLLPDPDPSQFIATAFHRNTLTNDEGGTDNEEFRTAAVMDRVNTTWSVLLGTTFNCVQCHSHPYDPFRHEEYYRFMAFFNNSRDEDTEADYPLLRHYKQDDSLKRAKLFEWLNKNTAAEKSKAWQLFTDTWQPSVNSLLCDEYSNAALVNGWYAGLRNGGTCRLPHIMLEGKQQVMFRYLNKYNDAKWFIYLDSLNGPLLQTISLVNTKNEWKVQEALIPSIPGRHHLYFKYYSPSLKDPLETGILFDWLRFDEGFPGKEKAGFDEAYKTFKELLYAKVETTPVMMENNAEQSRSTHVFERGNWLVKTDEVKAAVPAVLNPLPAGAPSNRLGLALWLTDTQNPLTARTMVNRFWEQLFGYGLAETLEDLGTQGVPPTHRELLDYLSWKFMHDHQWSMKKILKEIVLSATYRQHSGVTTAVLQKDPDNKWYARGPRVRLTAEQLRDQALAVSGLLSAKMYGPGVMPFQPDGIWRSPYNGQVWKLSEGEDQFRRAVYTYWKRTAPYPSMITFDGGTREVCVTRRIRTNTPLQALTTLNDSASLVMARYLAYRMEETGGSDINDRLEKGYEAMMFKPLTPARREALLQLYRQSFTTFKNDRRAAQEMVGAGDARHQPETAALVVVANALLNLDEWINKN